MGDCNSFGSALYNFFTCQCTGTKLKLAPIDAYFSLSDNPVVKTSVVNTNDWVFSLEFTGNVTKNCKIVKSITLDGVLYESGLSYSIDGTNIMVERLRIIFVDESDSPTSVYRFVSINILEDDAYGTSGNGNANLTTINNDPDYKYDDRIIAVAYGGVGKYISSTKKFDENGYASTQTLNVAIGVDFSGDGSGKKTIGYLPRATRY